MALPSPTNDWRVNDGLQEIPIEERAEDEVSHLYGSNAENTIERVIVTPQNSKTANPAFDITPRHLVSGLITERGVCDATPEALFTMFEDVVPSKEVEAK